MTGVSPWTHERVARLRRLWREGRSASEIALALGAGLSRNAVIGKACRIGLSRRRASAPGAVKPARRTERPPGPVRPPKPRRTSRAPAIATSNNAAPDLPPAGAQTVRSIGRHACRWPFGEPGSDGFRLCGSPAERGAYCAAHAARAYRPSSGRDHLLALAGL